MIEKVLVTNIQFGGRKLSSIAFLKSDTGDIFWEPTLFLLSRAQKGLSPATLDANAQDLTSFLNVVLTSSGNIDWKNISDEQMTAYIQKYLFEKKGLAEKSITRHIDTLKSYYEWAYRIQLIDRPKMFSWGYDSGIARDTNIDIGSKFIPKEDFDELQASLNTSNSYIIERDELILSFGYFTGTRAAEVVDPRNLNIVMLRRKINEASQQNRITIDVKIFGKGEKPRTIVIPPELFEALKKFVFGRRGEIGDGPLFCDMSGMPLNRQHASTVFRNAKSTCSDLIKNRLKDKSYHCLRHTFATNLVTYCYETNRDPWLLVPERMGHTDRSTTLQYIAWEAYINNRIDLVKSLSLGDEFRHKGGHHP